MIPRKRKKQLEDLGSIKSRKKVDHLAMGALRVTEVTSVLDP
jgi:hypothetical protein